MTNSRREGLAGIVPAVAWLPGYRRGWFAADALAGLALAAVAIPTAMGYSSVALAPVQAGLYALPAAMLLYAVFGSSRHVATGPSSTVALMSGVVIAGMGGTHDPARASALTAGVAVAAGVWLAVLGALRLGWVTDFISRPVIVGFSFGLALTVIVGEIPHMLGLPPAPPHFLNRVWSIGAHLGDSNPVTITVSVLGLVILFAGSARWPRVPWALGLMVASVIAAQFWHAASNHVEVIGAVPAGLPPIGLPDVAIGDLHALVLGGLAVAVVGISEGLSAARLFASRSHDRIDANAEFLGAGAANLGAGLSGGMSVCGSLSRTETAVASGARTQLTGVWAALVTLLFLLTLTGLLSGVPRAVLSVIVVNSVWFLLDYPALRHYRRVRQNDFNSAMVGLAGVVFLGPLYGILAAISLSLLGDLYRSSRVNIDALGKIPGEKAAWASAAGHPERRQVPGILVLRLDAPLFWANCEITRTRILEQIDVTDGVRALVLDLEATGQLDTTTSAMLKDLLEELRSMDVELFIARLHFLARGVLERDGFTDELGAGHTWYSISQSVAAAKRFVAGQPLPEVADAVAEDQAQPDPRSPDEDPTEQP